MSFFELYGVDYCRHYKIEDRCVICRLEKQVEEMQAEIDRLRAELDAERANCSPSEAREFTKQVGGES